MKALIVIGIVIGTGITGGAFGALFALAGCEESVPAAAQTPEQAASLIVTRSVEVDLAPTGASRFAAIHDEQQHATCYIVQYRWDPHATAMSCFRDAEGAK